MRHSPNYIHYQNKWQIVCLEPPEKCMNRDHFHRLFGDLNSSTYQCDYDDFSYKPNFCEFGKLRNIDNQAYSKLSFINGFLTLIEEWPDIYVGDFIDKSKKVLTCWFKCFPNTIAVTQQCVIRALVDPFHSNDSREFLGDKVMQVGPRLEESFSGMPFKIGFNMAVIRDEPDHNLSTLINAAINSWRDNTRVWIEVQGNVTFPQPINAPHPEISVFPTQTCKDFIEKEILAFLNKHDKQENEN